jgi:phosphopantothenate---cysteine ligase (CTP)
MRVIVTCGPSYEPIDQVRRLTNFSTGALGLALGAEMARHGHVVTLLKGEAATAHAELPAGVSVLPFTTNDNLLERLTAHAGEIDAIFHAAALCDYRVKTVTAADGAEVHAAKVPTRAGDITLSLEPTTKVLPRLRALFPSARIVGWKYELDGSRDEVLAKAARQLGEARSDACVVNGTAWGPGFGFVEPGREPVPISGRDELYMVLVQWLAKESLAHGG